MYRHAAKNKKFFIFVFCSLGQTIPEFRRVVPKQRQALQNSITKHASVTKILKLSWIRLITESCEVAIKTLYRQHANFITVDATFNFFG